MSNLSLQVKHSGIITLPRIVDERDGVLCIAEANRNIPFEIRRFYYITNLDSEASLRGKHAHRKLSQVIFCIAGSFLLTLDDGENTQEIWMNKAQTGILLGPGLYHTMHDFSNGCVILVAASDYFDEADYVRDYQEFKRLCREGFWK